MAYQMPLQYGMQPPMQQMIPHQSPIYPAMQPAPIVVTQPSTNQTTIVNNNNIAQQQNQQPVVGKPLSKQWSSSMVDCCQDLPSCFLGFCFPCCLSCWVAARYKETCCLGWWPAMCTMTPLRTKMRTEFQITGTICDDCICMFFCHPLILCQMARELNHHGIV